MEDLDRITIKEELAKHYASDEINIKVEKDDNSTSTLPKICKDHFPQSDEKQGFIAAKKPQPEPVNDISVTSAKYENNSNINTEPSSSNHKASTKLHQCDICQKIFSQAGGLKTHKLIHSGIKPHQCDV